MMGSTMTRRELGAKRCRYSMRIYEILARQGISGKDLGVLAGVSQQMVSSVITGRNHSKKVLDALRIAGVPEKYLFDPRKVETEEVV